MTIHNSINNISQNYNINTTINNGMGLIEIDNIYYLIEENPWNIVGVISLHKGYTFIGCAEYDNRVIIKTAFPDKICDIIGE